MLSGLLNARGTYRKAFGSTTGEPAIVYRDIYPLAAPTFENRLRMRSSRVSQTSR